MSKDKIKMLAIIQKIASQPKNRRSEELAYATIISQLQPKPEKLLRTI